MKKRILSMLLVLVLALALFPTAAFAASSEEEALGEINIFDGGRSFLTCPSMAVYAT